MERRVARGLVVEDEAPMAELIRRRLAESGHRVRRRAGPNCSFGEGWRDTIGRLNAHLFPDRPCVSLLAPGR
jgi:hypothetical protein